MPWLLSKERNRKMSEWISVNHRLPETDGIYIVCDRRLNGYPWIHTVGFRKVSSSWCELHGVYYDDGYGRYSDQDKFTHWMPLFISGKRAFFFPARNGSQRLRSCTASPWTNFSKTMANKKSPASVGALTGQARTENPKSVLLIAF